MPHSIMHISDLHRSEEDPITNSELISGLIGDRDRYIHENPQISPPSAIIVSGDIIQGVRIGTADYLKELEKQYLNAEEFLDELSKRFLNGDRSKIILIPGNHDVDWNTAYSSMESLDINNLPKDFSERLQSEKSIYRWDWKNLKPYKIKDTELYAKRLESFWNFFEKFYKDVPGCESLKRGADVNQYSLFDGKIGVAAFNSCHGNDCFAYHGNIPNEVVSNAHIQFRDTNTFSLQIAVWHHNYEGPPYRTDYMDVSILKRMIGSGFRLGLYGHQHRPQITPHQISLPDNETMAVVCSGSLCAGKRELPQGINRQYNILEIADDFKSVTVHVREMITENIFSPGRLIETGGKSFAVLKWELPKNTLGGVLESDKLRIRQAISNAELFLKSEKPKETLRLLSGIELPVNSHERFIAIEAAKKLEDWDYIINVIDPPTTIADMTLLVHSYLQKTNFELAEQVLDKYSQRLDYPHSLQVELKQRISVLRNLK